MSISKLFAFLPCWYRKLCQSHESSCSGFTERAKFSQAHLGIKPKLTRTKNKSLIPPQRIIWLSRCLGHWWALKVQSTLAQYPSEPQHNTVVLVEGKRGASRAQRGERGSHGPCRGVWAKASLPRGARLAKYLLCRPDKPQSAEAKCWKAYEHHHTARPIIDHPTTHHPQKKTACLPLLPFLLEPWAWAGSALPY